MLGPNVAILCGIWRVAKLANQRPSCGFDSHARRWECQVWVTGSYKPSLRVRFPAGPIEKPQPAATVIIRPNIPGRWDFVKPYGFCFSDWCDLEQFRTGPRGSIEPPRLGVLPE